MNSNSNSGPLRTKARKLRRKATVAVAEAEQIADSMVQRATGRVREIGQSGLNLLRDNPVKTALGALAVGLLMGLRARR